MGAKTMLSSRRGAVLGVLFTGLAATLAAACASYEPAATIDVSGPPFDDPATSFEDFRVVSSVVERRCGTLDCHGSMARPMRIFGQPGLRRPEDAGSDAVSDFAEYYPGGKVPTTSAELMDNYRAILALEPSLTELVVEGRLPPESLTLVRKYRLLEKHKGGRIFFEGDPGDRCIVSWLAGAVDEASCTQETTKP